MSVDATIMLPRSLPEVLTTNNSLKKSQSTSLHVMKLVWFLITVPTKTEPSTKPSTAHHERLAHEWAMKYNSCLLQSFVCLRRLLFIFMDGEQLTKKTWLWRTNIKSASYYKMCALYLTLYICFIITTFFRKFFLYFKHSIQLSKNYNGLIFILYWGHHSLNRSFIIIDI